MSTITHPEPSMYSYGIFRHIPDPNAVTVTYDATFDGYVVCSRATGHRVATYHPATDVYVPVRSYAEAVNVTVDEGPALTPGASVVAGNLVVDPDVFDEAPAAASPAIDEMLDAVLGPEPVIAVIDSPEPEIFGPELADGVLISGMGETKYEHVEHSPGCQSDAEPEHLIPPTIEQVQRALAGFTSAASGDDEWLVNEPSFKSRLEYAVNSGFTADDMETGGDRVLADMLVAVLEDNIRTLHFVTRDGVSVTWNG